MGAAFLLAVGLSLDGFGVGLSYGLRRIRIPFGSLAIIALCTIISMGTSMLLSHWVERVIVFIPTRWLGAIILLALGFIQLFKAIFTNNPMQPVTDESGVKLVQKPVPLSVLKIELKSLGIMIDILKSPAVADRDASGTISLGESVFLGGALSLDAFAAGIAASLSGMNISLVGMVAVTQLVMISIGTLLTSKISEKTLARAKYMPGMLLILVGIGKLI